MVNIAEIHDSAREKDIPIMLDDGMAFLLEYIRTHENIRDILECGTAVGYSAIRMASMILRIHSDRLTPSRNAFESNHSTCSMDIQR